MERYVCIHGHFYQPPRENAWLEEVELQDSAYPYHDWNERITAECYAPNGLARILDDQRRIIRLVNNYSRISFNFGPTLLAWLETNSPDTYAQILAADRESQERFSGHGSAMAQVFNHMIMPLATRRDKETQVRWGLADFRRRFDREPEGMWLAETAVDIETLEVLAEHGVLYTVLSPYQAARFRPVGEIDWQDAEGGRIDPTRAYVQKLPSGRSIALFFYDGPISRALAFERILDHAENFVNRLLGAFHGDRNHPQLVHIATDGETYGHHHPHGDMGLAYALERLEANPEVRLTNYGEYLEKHPPTHEVQVFENSSWSCFHGIERWRGNCGCNSGRSWHQEWRAPLRAALDFLRDTLLSPFERKLSRLLKDPWAARDAYIHVILDRSDTNVESFLEEHASRPLSPREKSTVLKLLEMQRHTLLMYTSCGWFFDDVSGIETVQVIEYAGRALQLAREMFGADLEAEFLDRIQKAKSNLPEQRDGRRIYERYVRPVMLDWDRVAAHYAVSSLFETYPENVRIFSYVAESLEFKTFEAGKAKMIAGKARFHSRITLEKEELAFGVLHFGDHNVNGGVRKFRGDGEFRTLVDEMAQAFAKADFPEIIRVMDRGFGGSTYSLRSLFRDEQREITRRVLRPSLSEAENVYRRLYDQHLPTMRFLADLGVPLPRAFQVAADYLLNADLNWAIEDHEPDCEMIRRLMKDSATWKVGLDTAGLAYRLKKSIARLADRCREQPDNLALLQAFEDAVDLARDMPFEVDLWYPQNVHWNLGRSCLPDIRLRARAGDQDARDWLEHFLVLGEKLGLRVEENRQDSLEAPAAMTTSHLLDSILHGPRIPGSTYRLQFHRGFTFDDALLVLEYLRDLGIGDVYASPILQAVPGSPHGYDICDHSRINPELGGEEGLHRFTEALRKHSMGLLLDMVPNHMGVNHPSNGWWMDVLENGPSSVYAAWFDIDWQPVNPNLRNKVLLPILGDQYGTVLENGQIRLGYEDGAFFLFCYETKLPVAPRTYIPILEYRLESLAKNLGDAHVHLQELQSIITGLSYLPPRTTELPFDKVEERNREKEVIKRRLAVLVEASPDIQSAIEETLAVFNGQVGDPHSFDLLDALIEDQAYRPAFWRVATEEINYRRFFDINELAAIRMEKAEVFQATHQVVMNLLAQGTATGLRIDHPDGLWNPARYFLRLQEEYLTLRARHLAGADEPGTDWKTEAVQRLRDFVTDSRHAHPWPLYVVAEKILAETEPLPPDWAVAGTSGYDFLNVAQGLFVQPSARQAFDDLYAWFIGRTIEFEPLVKDCQQLILRMAMTSELNALSHQLDRISEANRRYRDFTLNSLTYAVREIIASLMIYRTYITGPEDVPLRDRNFLEEAVEDAKTRNPRLAEPIFDFVRDTLLFRNLEAFREQDRTLLIDWVMKFQQTTGPVLAKGMEDTACYIFNRLACLSEVGGHPDHFGFPPAAFHRHNLDKLQRWPHAMLTSSTHDTKRSEDVRARIAVLSEMPEEWRAALARFRDLNAPKKTFVQGRAAPDPNDEYLLYQILLGAWPLENLDPEHHALFRDRILRYMEKATREAKVHTSWINPDREYDEALRDFILRILPLEKDDLFLQDLLSLQEEVAFFGHINSLAQVLLKVTSPGVPDIYQGNELWDFSLVDPDNRRSVDFSLRQRFLKELQARITDSANDRMPFSQALANSWKDGRIKMYVLHTLLKLRGTQPDLFTRGIYLPLDIRGLRHEHAVAYLRQCEDQSLIVLVPRLVRTLTAGVPRLPLDSVWEDTRSLLPPEFADRTWRNLFTGETLKTHAQEGQPCLAVGAMLRVFPVAALLAE